jgi:hypothetical protein
MHFFFELIIVYRVSDSIQTDFFHQLYSFREVKFGGRTCRLDAVISHVVLCVARYFKHILLFNKKQLDRTQPVITI